MSQNRLHPATSLGTIIGLDIKCLIAHLKKTLTGVGHDFNYELFTRYSQGIEILLQLLQASLVTEHDIEEEKEVCDAIDALVSDICFPFLLSFYPSFDSRPDLNSAILVICDLVHVSLGRGSPDMLIKSLQLCLHSMSTFRKDNANQTFTGSASSGRDSGEHTLDIICALELLRSIIGIGSPENNQKKDLIENLADFFFPLSEETSCPHISSSNTFWFLIQSGLHSDDPALRKRSMYLLKRIIDTCEKSNKDFSVPPAVTSADIISSLPCFWWSKQYQKELSKVWEDFILLLETLDEKQTHVIKPILPRMQSVTDAATFKQGHVLLHTSWLVTLLTRAFVHESVYIVRWAAETVLHMDFTKVPMMQQGQKAFLTHQLLGFLQDLKLYTRQEGSHVGSCSGVGSGLKGFFASCCAALKTQQEQADFVQHILQTIVKDNWASVPLVFITQGLSCIPSSPVLTPQALLFIREVATVSLRTLEIYTRGAIECFLTKAVLRLIDKSKVSIEEFVETLAVMDRDENLKRGTHLWDSVVSWLLMLRSDTIVSGWTWVDVQSTLTSMADIYLKVSEEIMETVSVDTVQVTKIARLLVLLADCESRLKIQNVAEQKEGAAHEVLAQAADVIKGINIRAYMPTLRADRAICLLCSCTKDIGTDDKGSQIQKSLCMTVSDCWADMLLYIERRVLHSTFSDKNVDLELIVFYCEAVKTLGQLLPTTKGISGLTTLANSCTKFLSAIKTCSELVLEVEGDQIQFACKLALAKALEEIRSSTFWLKIEAFINMVLQPALLKLPNDTELGSYTAELLKSLFSLGVEKTGTVNLVMARLYRLWSEPGGTELALHMVPTIVDACMFGTVHKKPERLWLDVCMYIETLKEECSVNEIMSSCWKNDTFVRVMTANYLSKLRPDVAAHRQLAIAVLRELWEHYVNLAQKSTFRQFANSISHRQKHRLSLMFPVLDQFITEETCVEFWENAWQGLVLECHPSVRHNLEWMVMRLATRFPSLLPRLWNYFSQFSDKRNVSLCSLLNIITHLGPELRKDLQEAYYMQALPLALPWCMAHHFNTRLHGLACVLRLWEQCQAIQLLTVMQKFDLVQHCLKFTQENSNSSKVVLKLLDNYFYKTFHFRQDYSMETLFHTLPRLACISDEEWIGPELFQHWDSSWQMDSSTYILPLYNSSKKLSACPPGPWRMKAHAENDEDVCESTDGDVQKKIIPWRLMTPDSHVEQEYTCRKKGYKPGGLILVTSLINKVPNLGGLCRTSEIFGVSEFVIGNLSYLNDHVFQSLSVTAEKWIPITEVPPFRVSEYLEEKKRESYTLVGVEQTANSVCLTNFKFPKKTLLLLGKEREGIPPELLQQLDVCVEIPQQGIIRSLNVHVSGALLIWEYARQHMDMNQT
ncbi:hypothetical protein C0Q70_13939 [Pomacea canaliculata]|uniref:tRNA (guanosine(18)-2'-O)-methyltransferase TARBP1 n=1 Tax=Pomacea canaliculata TaxID=400727 RepID=A0A2T7NYM8_POMCA|nr:hypothetical protein C0Q70_13939 [Pomacea canaliculata]